MTKEQMNTMFEHIRNVQYKYLDIQGDKVFQLYTELYENNLPITFQKHRHTIYTVKHVGYIGDVIVGFYSDTDVEFDLVLVELNGKVKYKLKAKEFAYIPDILYRFNSYLKAENPIEVYVIYGFVHRDLAHMIRNMKSITEMFKGEHLNYIEDPEYKPVLSDFLYIPPLYFEQQEEKRLRREFTKPGGLHSEIMEVVWHPDNYHKFKDLEPEFTVY